MLTCVWGGNNGARLIIINHDVDFVLLNLMDIFTVLLHATSEKDIYVDIYTLVWAMCMVD